MQYKYTNYYGSWDHELYFVLQCGFYGRALAIEARRVNGGGHCFDHVGSSEYLSCAGMHKPFERTYANDGCIWGDTYHGESDLIDQMILAGYLTVTGRTTDDGRGVELRLNDEWAKSLPVELSVNSCNICGYDANVVIDEYRRAATFHRNEFKWQVVEYDPYHRGDWEVDSTHGWQIYIESPLLPHRSSGFSTGSYESLADAWSEAVRLECAANEVLKSFQHASNTYGIPVETLMSAFDCYED